MTLDQAFEVVQLFDEIKEKKERLAFAKKSDNLFGIIMEYARTNSETPAALKELVDKIIAEAEKELSDLEEKLSTL